MTTALAIQNGHDAPSHEIAHQIAGTIEQLKAIRTFINEQFDRGRMGTDGKYLPGLDAGKIPGCGDKETLFLPGAQKAVMYFNCRPTYKIHQQDLGNGHVTFRIRCILISRGSREEAGEGVGCCSTMEKKYRWRGSERLCPTCGKPAIRFAKDRKEFYCWAKLGGCGAKFHERHSGILSQGDGSPVENTDLYDLHNTVLKMAKKRAFVDAAITLGCLSELFTQDIEDTYAATQVREAVRPHEDVVNGEVMSEYKPEPEPAPRNAPVQNNSGNGTGMYASAEETKVYLDWLKVRCDQVNEKWEEKWDLKLEQGLAVPDVKELVNVFQGNGHLLKWAVENGRLDRSIVPEDAKIRQVGPYVAIVFHRSDEDRKALKVEFKAYSVFLAQRASDAIYRLNPDLAPTGWAEEQEEAAEDEGATPVPPKPKKPTKAELAEQTRQWIAQKAAKDLAESGRGDAYEPPADAGGNS